MYSQTIACDIHPLNNLRVMQFLGGISALRPWNERWSRHWITEGVSRTPGLPERRSSMGLYCEGDSPTLADITPRAAGLQHGRIGVDLAAYPVYRAH